MSPIGRDSPWVQQTPPIGRFWIPVCYEYILKGSPRNEITPTSSSVAAFYSSLVNSSFSTFRSMNIFFVTYCKWSSTVLCIAVPNVHIFTFSCTLLCVHVFKYIELLTLLTMHCKIFIFKIFIKCYVN